MYYVRCNTRSSGASAKGTPTQALEYITGAHDAERDPSYSNAELAYIARLDPGWKSDLEGGRVPLIGLGALRDCSDQDVLARDFERACQPFHDLRGSTGYLSYTFTMPKELSLVAEGHAVKSRQAMYAALQRALDSTFTGKEYAAVAAVHARNEAGEVHYHAHVLIGKFARDTARGRVFSLNSRAGGNTGKARLRTLKQGWKDALDAELKRHLGLTVNQVGPYARPALTLADGTYVPALNRESRRILDKHLCFRMSETTASGATKTRNFRWTHFNPTIYELTSSKRAGGWSSRDFCDLFPELAARLKTYESRVMTLKRIGYLTTDGRVTDAFTLHYRVHKGDHPELQKIRADLYKLARAKKTAGSGGQGSPPPPSPSDAGQGEPLPARSIEDENVDLWLTLHRHQRLIKRLDRLGVSPAQFTEIHEEARRRSRPSAQMLRHLRAAAQREAALGPNLPGVPGGKGVIRAYCAVQRSQVVSFFVLAKGLLTLRPGQHAALASKIRQRARIDYFYAKERRLGRVARRLRPLFWIGRIVMPGEVQRLELALRRCNDLAVQQHADAIFREQRARIYRNSRESLVAQLRQEARRSTLDVNPGLAQQESDLRSLATPSASGVPLEIPDPSALAQLRRGMDVLQQHRPEHYALLARWRDRELDLVATLLAQTKQQPVTVSPREHEVAMLAGRIGYLLEREGTYPSPTLPPLFESQAQEITRANARLAAAGINPLFPVDVLRTARQVTIIGALDALREAGLLVDGPAWALRADSAQHLGRRLRQNITVDLNRQEDIDR